MSHNDSEGEVERLRHTLQRIATMAHMAWLSPKTVRPIFEKIEYDARKALGENPSLPAHERTAL